MVANKQININIIWSDILFKGVETMERETLMMKAAWRTSADFASLWFKQPLKIILKVSRPILFNL